MERTMRKVTMGEVLKVRTQQTMLEFLRYPVVAKTSEAVQ
jgi:hypothetical protein